MLFPRKFSLCSLLLVGNIYNLVKAESCLNFGGGGGEGGGGLKTRRAPP